MGYADGVFGERFVNFSGVERSSVVEALTSFSFPSFSFIRPIRLASMMRAIAAIQWSLSNALPLDHLRRRQKGEEITRGTDAHAGSTSAVVLSFLAILTG